MGEEANASCCRGLGGTRRRGEHGNGTECRGHGSAQDGDEGPWRRRQGTSGDGQGRCPFNADTLLASLKTIEAKSKGLFPDMDASKTGDSDALPIAFEQRADIMARLAKISADAKAAAAAIKVEASFKAEWPKVVSNCGGCHKEYRKPKQ